MLLTESHGTVIWTYRQRVGTMSHKPRKSFWLMDIDLYMQGGVEGLGPGSMRARISSPLLEPPFEVLQ